MKKQPVPFFSSFPRTVEELEQWQVWRDALLADGDPLGEALAADLRLGPDAKRGDLEGFWRAMRRRCRTGSSLEVGWCLGFARVVRVRGEPQQRLIKGPPGIYGEVQLRELEQFMQRPAARMLERVELSSSPTMMRNRVLRQSLAKLPAGCSEVALVAQGYGAPDDARPLLDALPATVKTLQLDAGPGTSAAAFVDPRLETLDLRFSPKLESDALRGALEGAPKLRVVLGSGPVDAAGSLPIGQAGDAGLLNPRSRVLTLLPRAPLLGLQRRLGLISALAQVARLAPERYFVGATEIGLRAAADGGSDLMRHGDGRWTLAAREGEERAVDGAVVEPGAVRELQYRSRVTIARQSYLFIDDVGQRPWRELA